MKPRFHTTVLVAAAIAGLLAGPSRAEDNNSNSIKFSDPSKPGTLKISLGRGELRVQGTDTNEVSVKTDAKVVENKPRKDGLRVISAASSYSLREKDNVVTVDAAANEWGGRGNSDFRITVPRNTTVIVQNAWGGNIQCSDISGDVEINSMHGEIKLEEVSGGVVVSTMNGEIKASIRELKEGRPLNFTSMNGEVVVRLPSTAKANVRLRTQNGSVLTDFEESALVTKTESSPGIPRGKMMYVNKGGRVLSAEIQDAIREATQISASAVKEALEAIKEGLESAKLDAEEARKQFEKANRDMERARREAERAGRPVKVPTSPSAAAAAPAAPAAPGEPAELAKPAPMAMVGPGKLVMPTISGGKLVTGTLNGGGPEISVSTMNGDVTLRKLEGKR